MFLVRVFESKENIEPKNRKNVKKSDKTPKTKSLNLEEERKLTKFIRYVNHSLKKSLRCRSFFLQNENKNTNIDIQL